VAAPAQVNLILGVREIRFGGDWLFWGFLLAVSSNFYRTAMA
jgi:hypothetical protein